MRTSRPFTLLLIKHNACSDASGYPNLPDTRVPGHFWATRYPTFHAGRVPGSTRYPTLKTRVPGGYLTDLKLPEIVLQKA